MAKQRYYLDTRVLTAFFFAAMPFVAFGSFVVVNMARTQLRESVGLSLEQRAVQTKLALEQYVADQVVHLRLLALESSVMQALGSAAKPLSADEVRRLEQAWAAGQDPKLLAAVLDSPVAPRLKAMAQIRPAMKAIQVVDRQGRVIAASARGGRLFQGESSWFKELAAQEGEPQAWVGDIHRPGSSAVALLDIAYPVRDSGGAWLGAVRALLDAADIYTVLAPVRVGRTGHAVLVRSTDGMILASDESERILKMVFPGFDSLQNALEGFPLGESGQAIFGRARLRRGYWTIPEVKGKSDDGRDLVIEPTRFVGFSPIDQVPDVKWLVAVEQDSSEALAPIATVTRYLWMHFVGVFATVILLALYFSFKLERPVMEEDLHLHEEHLPAGMKKVDEN
jgi:hypothetical protein